MYTSAEVDYHVRQIYLKHAQPQAMLTIMLGKSTSSMHNLRRC
jgi:hypothetical protein